MVIAMVRVDNLGKSAAGQVVKNATPSEASQKPPGLTAYLFGRQSFRSAAIIKVYSDTL